VSVVVFARDCDVFAPLAALRKTMSSKGRGG
jgi:hypothetical protein